MNWFSRGYFGYIFLSGAPTARSFTSFSCSCRENPDKHSQNLSDEPPNLAAANGILYPFIQTPQFF